MRVKTRPTADTRLVEKPHRGVDTEARWVRKARKCHFDHKLHSVVNQDGLVIAGENEGDTKHLGTPLKKAHVKKGTPVMADRAMIHGEQGDAFPLHFTWFCSLRVLLFSTLGMSRFK